VAWHLVYNLLMVDQVNCHTIILIEILDVALIAPTEYVDARALE